MILLVGLGNPGPKFAGNRHNAGFMVADEIARQHGFSPWRSKFQGEICDGQIAGEKVLLLKPMTFMNESGRSVGEAMRFYNLAPDDIVVFHDELDLPPGKFRMKTGGGHAGNNGLRSVIGHIGADFHRARFGIGHPGHREKVHGYVLKDFSKQDLGQVEPLRDALVKHAGLLAERKFATYQNKVHLELAPAQPERRKPVRPEPAKREPSQPEPVKREQKQRQRAGQDTQMLSGSAGGDQDDGVFSALKRLLPGNRKGDE